LKYSTQGIAEGNIGLLDVLLATAVDGILLIDAKGVVLVYSAACERLFGYGSNEVLGKSVKMLMPGSFEKQHGNQLPNAGETGEPWTVGASREIVGRHKDQTTFPMCLSVGEGNLDGQKIFVGILHNLTNRKLDDTIREREANLRSILDTVPDAIVMLDEKGLIESFSSAASLLFGYAAAEVVGKTVMMLMPSPYREQHDGHLIHFPPATEQSVVSKSRIVVGLRRDGSTFPMELAIGKVVGGPRRLFTTFVRDITRRQGTEQRLEELQSELLHVSRLSAMGQMTAAIAHELNQPLTAITNYVKAAKRTLEAASIRSTAVARVQEMIDKAAEQTLRAGAIIKKLRDFVEKRDSDHKPENLNNVIAEALALAFVGAADENVKVKLQLDASLAPVMIDRIQIQQVLLNLIRNSIEAMHLAEKRELILTTSSGDAGFVDVTVQDTGPGLSQDVSTRLFQHFVTTKDSGMGIGLTICQSILEAHGGRIWLLKSTPAGTTFRFRLPLASNLAAAA
jgi:two-component system sensor kinase FixL